MTTSLLLYFSLRGTDNACCWRPGSSGEDDGAGARRQATIRELQNLMERATLLSRGPSLRVPLAEILNDPGVSGGNKAASRLGLKRTSLAYKMQKLVRDFSPRDHANPILRSDRYVDTKMADIRISDDARCATSIGPE